MSRGKLLKFGSLWKKSSGNAGDYWTGVIGDIPPGVEVKKGMRILIFANKQPSKDSSPSHYLMTPAPEEDRDPGDENPNW